MKRRVLIASVGSVLSPVAGGCLSWARSSEGFDSLCPAVAETIDIEADGRVDNPPHEIGDPYEVTHPEQPDDSGADADGFWTSGSQEYLGDSIDTTPTLSFETWHRQHAPMEDPLEASNKERYRVQVFQSMAELTEAVDIYHDHAVSEELAAVDFENSAVLAIESARETRMWRHHVARIEETTTGVHVQAYHGAANKDQNTRDRVMAMLIAVERPETLEGACVSVTVAEDRRVHFTSTEGVVALGD